MRVPVFFTFPVGLHYLYSPARPTGRGAEHAMMEKLLSDMKAHSSAWPFQQPVSEKEVLDYYDVITSPMGAPFHFLFFDRACSLP